MICFSYTSPLFLLSIFGLKSFQVKILTTRPMNKKNMYGIEKKYSIWKEKSSWRLKFFLPYFLRNFSWFIYWFCFYNLMLYIYILDANNWRSQWQNSEKKKIWNLSGRKSKSYTTLRNFNKENILALIWVQNIESIDIKNKNKT